MNDENLKPFSERTESEQREIRSKGGKASGEARRAKKTIAEALRKVLDEELPDSGMTKREAIAAKCVKKLYDSGKMEDLVKLAQLTGEYQQNINLGGDGVRLSIEVADKNTADELAKLSNTTRDNDDADE